jgi:nicotinate-nucleotide pyrophosphorylase (carboxylating)
MTPPSSTVIRRIVEKALEEDLGLGDATTAALFERAVSARARMIAQQPMVVAGVLVAEAVYTEVDPAVKILRRVPDGEPVTAGTIVLEVEGDGRSLLMAERVALNFLQRLSGIATLTARFRDAIRGYRCRILDTRKTTPGLRALEKWAVRLGGGLNHRHSLADGLLIKDNHLALLKAQNIRTAEACRLARERGPHGLRVIVEAESLPQAREALAGQADVILLDNMSSTEVKEAVEIIKGRALVEVSGGITLENVRDMAAAGADFISIGALTHSAPAADLSMELIPLRVHTRKPRHGRHR